jgi:hypothetical protein
MKTDCLNKVYISSRAVANKAQRILQQNGHFCLVTTSGKNFLLRADADEDTISNLLQEITLGVSRDA